MESRNGITIYDDDALFNLRSRRSRGVPSFSNTELMPVDFSDPSRGLTSTVYEQPGFFTGEATESFDFSAGTNILAGAADSITTTLIQSDERSTENNILTSMPKDYSFQFTDINNRKQAMDASISKSDSELSIFNTVRGAVDSIADLAGPEVAIPVQLFDTVFGNAFAALFFDQSSNLDAVDYQRVTTYGDFGSSINQDSSYRNQPQSLVDSVTNFNG